MGLTVALDDKGEAEGQLFWDDGQSIGKYDLIPREPACHSEHRVVEVQHVPVVPQNLPLCCLLFETLAGSDIFYCKLL